jgi:hypothetical protein
MLNFLVVAIFAGMAALVAYEIIAEIRGGSGRLHDRYHE